MPRGRAIMSTNRGNFEQFAASLFTMHGRKSLRSLNEETGRGAWEMNREGWKRRMRRGEEEEEEETETERYRFRWTGR